MPTPNFPFDDQHPFPGRQNEPSIPTPWLGGMLVPVAPSPVNANKPVKHYLNRTPRFCWVMDIDQNPNNIYGTSLTSPLPRGVSNWDYNNAFLNWPSTGYPVLLFFG